MFYFATAQSSKPLIRTTTDIVTQYSIDVTHTVVAGKCSNDWSEVVMRTLDLFLPHTSVTASFLPLPLHRSVASGLATFSSTSLTSQEDLSKMLRDLHS